MLSRKNKELRTIKDGVVGKYVKKDTPPEMPSECYIKIKYVTAAKTADSRLVFFNPDCWLHKRHTMSNCFACNNQSVNRIVFWLLLGNNVEWHSCNCKQFLFILSKMCWFSVLSLKSNRCSYCYDKEIYTFGY